MRAVSNAVRQTSSKQLLTDSMYPYAHTIGSAHPMTFRSSWLEGAVNGVWQALLARKAIMNASEKAMVLARVKYWLEHGVEVRIFTARATELENIPAIQDWLEKECGLPRTMVVTCIKTYDIVELWDDRARQVVQNTGQSLCGGNDYWSCEHCYWSVSAPISVHPECRECRVGVEYTHYLRRGCKQ